MNTENKTPEQVCREVVEASASSFAISFRYLPEAQRRGMEAVYAYCRHTDDLADEPGDPVEKGKALKAWRDQLISDEPTHPIIIAARQAAEEFQFNVRHLQAVALGCEQDLREEDFQDFNQLETYCAKVAGAVGHMCLAIWGVRGPKADNLAEALGLAVQLTNILRDVKEDAERGRIYLPLEVLRVNGAKPEDVLNGNMTPGVRRTLEYVSNLATKAYERASFKEFTRQERKRLWPARIIRGVYEPIHAKIVRRNYEVFGERIRISKMRRALIALRVLLMSRFT